MNKETKRPVIIGEVLFDCFPDGSSVLGGAPFNVAWHLHGLGLSPLMISSVGKDSLGEQVLDSMKKWGMDTRAMQISDSCPTGQVTVSFNDGEPAYEIVQDQAYDNMDLGFVLDHLKLDHYSLLYRGTLIVRTSNSRSIFDAIKENVDLPAFIDINLRPPWWSYDDIQHALSNGCWVKMNKEELATVTKSHHLSDDEIKITAQNLLSDYDLESLIVTLGSEGALYVTKSEVFQGPPVQVDELIDTVGAGDSFSAVLIMGLMYGWPQDQTLHRALDFAAAVCSMRGATTSDHGFYTSFLDKWNE